MAYELHYHSVRLFESFLMPKLVGYELDMVTVLHHHMIAYMVMSVLKLTFHSYRVKYSSHKLRVMKTTSWRVLSLLMWSLWQMMVLTVLMELTLLYIYYSDI